MQKRSIIILLLIVLFGVSVFILKSTSIPIISNLTQKIAASPKSWLYSARTNKNENDKKIAEENESLRQKLVDFEKLKRDNLALRDQFEGGLQTQFRLLPARILGAQGSFSKPSELIIDQGTESGVKRGMAVVVKNNLLGRIETTSDQYSKVSLIRSQKFSTLARTSDTNALGIARGRQDFILFEKVSINDRMSSGQLLLTRGEINSEGFGIPPDFIIGKITQVDRNESLPTQSAKVEAGIDVAKLDIVFVIIK